MSRKWEIRKQVNREAVEEIARRSPVLTCLDILDGGTEWRTLLLFDSKTLVCHVPGEIQRAGPLVVGIRYHERFLSQAPDPFEIVTLLEPRHIFHPNVAPTGAMCLGHPQAGITMDLILNQVWAGLMFNINIVNTRTNEVVNPIAAEYVRSNADKLFPITPRGLFEEPDVALRTSRWYVSDPRSQNRKEE